MNRGEVEYTSSSEISEKFGVYKGTEINRDNKMSVQ